MQLQYKFHSQQPDATVVELEGDGGGGQGKSGMWEGGVKSKKKNLRRSLTRAHSITYTVYVATV